MVRACRRGQPPCQHLVVVSARLVVTTATLPPSKARTAEACGLLKVTLDLGLGLGPQLSVRCYVVFVMIRIGFVIGSGSDPFL